MKKKIIICFVIIVLLCSCAYVAKAFVDNKKINDAIKEREALVKSETVSDTLVESVYSSAEKNMHGTLSVPTYITKIDNQYFIVDCYHNQVIFNDNLEEPLTEWEVMISDLNRPHSIASDGTVYIVDDTDNHQLVVMKRVEGTENSTVFVTTQKITGVGNRPHYSIYQEDSGIFYVWSSQSGEMYLFERKEGSYEIELKEIKVIPELSEVYVRSFTIMDDSIYFISGNNNVIEADLESFKVLNRWPVVAEIGGMVQLTKIQNYYYITVSTDAYGNTELATIIRTDDLSKLGTGEYEVLYDLFGATGTPYNMIQIDDLWYLTHHKMSGTLIWQFEVQDDNIINIEPIY